MKVSTLNPWLRRILQVSIFEIIAIAAITAGAMLLTNQDLMNSSAYAALTSIIAVAWNYLYNTIYEFWESRQKKKGRTVFRRIVHATLFEIGLVLIFVPLMAWWFSVSPLNAFIAQIGILIFFLCYSISFNWCFDRIVGLPRSAVA